MPKRKIPQDAFTYYMTLGPSGTYEQVAEKYEVSKRAIAKLASKERWQEQVAELNEKARRASAERALETLEDMNSRHMKSMQVIQKRALEALKSMTLQSAMDAVRALDISIKQERTIRGEPSDRTAVSVEDTIKREFQRWTVVEEEGNDDDENSQAG